MSSSHTAAGTESASRRWIVLAVVGFAQLMVVLDATIVNIALPSAQADLGFSTNDRQWIITAYSLAFGSLLLFGGKIGDLLGRKRTFIIGIIGFAAASALGGAAQSFDWLVTARVIQGAFGALLSPTALAVLTTTFTIPKERARAFGVFGAIAGAGGAIGLLLGGILTQSLDWRWNLYVNDIIAVFAIIGAIMFVKHTDLVGPRPKLDYLGTVLVTLGLFSLVFGFSHANTDGWGAFITWGPLVASGILLIAFVLWQRRASEPLLPLSILLDRNRGAAFSSILIAGVGAFALFLFLTYYLQTTLHYTPLQTGVSFLPMIGMLVIAAQVGTTILVPRLGPKILVPIGMVIGVVGMIYFTHLNASSTYAADVLAPLMILGFGMGTVIPASIQNATLGVDAKYAGVASALVNTSQQVGGSVGTALLNTLAATAISTYIADHLPPTPTVQANAAIAGYNTAYWWGAGFFAAGAIISALLFRRKGQGLTVGQEDAATVETPAVN
ncbi:MAG TPA: MFS transporter [Galbitalea sp.]|jgi:EmrB/QacA subfamily drug resistance transporter